jgi:hypothetical protein
MGAPAGRRISSITSYKVEGVCYWQAIASILAAETSFLVGIYNILLPIGAFIRALPLIMHAIRNEKDVRRQLYRSLRPFIRSTRRQLRATAGASCEDSEATTRYAERYRSRGEIADRVGTGRSGKIAAGA